MSDALSSPFTPNALDAGSTCVQFAIPDDPAIRAAWLDFAAHLGNPENWKKYGAIDEYQCAALIAKMIEDGLNTPCETGNGGEGNCSMEYWNRLNIISGEVDISIPLNPFYQSIIVRGIIGADGTGVQNLRANFDAIETANIYRSQYERVIGATLSGSSLTSSTMLFGAGALARSTDTPPHSFLELTVNDFADDTKHTSAQGTIWNAGTGALTRFAGAELNLRVAGYLLLYAQADNLGTGYLDIWGVTGNAE